MNALEQWLSDNQQDATAAMNALQAFGIVSDNCVTAAEVSDSDADKAIKFLNIEMDKPMI